MDRSRSKRSYYYDHQDYDPEPYSRTRPKYMSSAAHNPHHYAGSRHRGGGGGGGGGEYGSGGGGGGRMGGKVPDSPGMVTTSYRILCHDAKVGGVIGKSGSIIKAIRQHTGAWINVHELMNGDEERIIEISDARRRDPDGRMPAFSPAQEALFLIHERILESEAFGYDDCEYGGGSRAPPGRTSDGRVVTKLVVSKMHVGSLLGKGGKIIEQMRIETKTQIRILPRDHNLPRCISLGEEIVQIVGEVNAVKSAIANISSRLKESQHRDRSHFQGRQHSEDRYNEDDHSSRKSSLDGARLSNSSYNRTNNYSSRAIANTHEYEAATQTETNQASFEDLVFRILCPKDRIDSVVGESDGIVELLQNEIGVSVKVADPVEGSDERIIVISSDEGPNDELFPAQEALLHIQTRIVDLVQDKDNIVTTRLLVPSSDVGGLSVNGFMSEMKKSTGADVELVPREKIPAFISVSDELIQITGEIKAAREALVEVTAKIRSHLHKVFLEKDIRPQSNSLPTVSNGPSVTEAANISTPAYESIGNGPHPLASNKIQVVTSGLPSKDGGLSSSETSKQNESERREDTPTSLNRIQVPLVTRSTLEVVIPEYAVTRLLGKSKNKLAQISELSGANVTLMDDAREAAEKVIIISGTPEQAERAQSLFQGFFLSIQEDGP